LRVLNRLVATVLRASISRRALLVRRRHRIFAAMLRAALSSRECRADRRFYRSRHLARAVAHATGAVCRQPRASPVEAGV